MEYTVYSNEFERIDDAPVGTKKEVSAWMRKHFPGLKKKSSPEENEASIFFFDGDVVAYDTANDGEVYLVELEEDKDDSGEDESTDDLSEVLDFGSNQSADSASFTAELKIGRKMHRADLSKTDCGWSLEKIDPLPSGTVVIPAEIDGRTIISLSKYLFRNASKLVSVEMPDTILNIPGQVYHGAFSGCDNLNTVKLSKKLKVLGSGTFADCSALESVELPDSIEQLGSCVFVGCKSLRTIKMPAGLSEIGANLFEGCSSLVLVEFAEGMTTIWQDVFKDCESLEEVIFPASFDPYDLGSTTFRNCPKLKRVVFKIPEPEDFDRADFSASYFDDSPNVKIVFRAEESCGANGNKK